MSYITPSAEEADKYYYYFKNQYNEAARQKNYYDNREADCYRERNKTASQLAASKSEKLNLEKRVYDIEAIIKMLEGTLFSLVNVPSYIEKANKAVSETDKSYRSCIKVSGLGTASIESAFKVPTVEGDVHSSNALNILKREKTITEQKIENLKASINSMTEIINGLNREINNCNLQEAVLSTKMVNSSIQIQYFQKFRY